MSNVDENIALAFVQGFDAILKPLGFKRARLTWSRSLSSMQQIIWLEKSTWHNGFYLRYGLSLEKKPRSSESKIDVEWGSERNLPTEINIKLDEVLNFDRPMANADRCTFVSQTIQEYVLPAFEATNSVDRLREVLENKQNPFYTSMTSFLVEEL